MYLLLSGEGSGDMGVCNPASESCDSDNFKPGPMAWMVDQLIETYQGFEFSHLSCASASYVSEKYLADNKPKRLKKAMALRGKKKPAETKYYYENARALAIAANAKAKKLNDKVVAVLFRDADGTASAGRGNWRDKRNSMIKGFNAESFESGVAMMPKPKSEAWLLCAVKDNPYQHCCKLEDESGNDKSANSLKKQLSKALDGKDSTAELNELLSDGTIDPHQIDMSSFNAFKEDLEAVVKAAHQ